jgi:hypothetical protein
MEGREKRNVERQEGRKENNKESQRPILEMKCYI